MIPARCSFSACVTHIMKTQPTPADKLNSRLPDVHPTRPSQTPNPLLCLSSSSFLMHSDYPASITASEHLNISPLNLTFHLGGEALYRAQALLYQAN